MYLNELIESMLIILEAGGLLAGSKTSMRRPEGIQPIRRICSLRISGVWMHLREVSSLPIRSLAKSPYKKFRKERYASFDSGKGKDLKKGSWFWKTSGILQLQMANQNRSAGSRVAGNIINQYI